MSIICSICGGTDVKCAAVIDPNTKQFLDFGYEAFLDGECSRCGNVALTDSDEVKTDMDKRWAEYMAQHHTAPNYARCDIVRHGAYDGCEGACIRIGGPENAVEKYRIVAVCRDLEELKLRRPTQHGNLPSWNVNGSSSTRCRKTRPTTSK